MWYTLHWYCHVLTSLLSLLVLVVQRVKAGMKGWVMLMLHCELNLSCWQCTCILKNSVVVISNYPLFAQQAVVGICGLHPDPLDKQTYFFFTCSKSPLKIIVSINTSKSWILNGHFLLRRSRTISEVSFMAAKCNPFRLWLSQIDTFTSGISRRSCTAATFSFLHATNKGVLPICMSKNRAQKQIWRRKGSAQKWL